MSAPSSPGGTSSASASRSHAIATCAPAACARAMKARQSCERRRPWPGTARGRRRPSCRRRIRNGSARQDLDAVGGGARAEDVDGLRDGSRSRRRWRTGSPPLAAACIIVHRLGRGGRLVEQRGVRDLERREVAHHRLEVEEGLQAALGDLGLVGRVLGVPAGVLEDVALDDGRRDARRVAHADVALVDLVLGGHPVEVLEEIVLALRGGERQWTAQADRARDRLFNELVE